MSKKKDRRQKHIPMRMCILTRKRMPKYELMRLVRIDDKVFVDPKGKMRGRGANITMDVDVFDQAAEKGIIGKSLKLGRKLTKDEVIKLRRKFIKAIEEKKFRKGSKPVVLKVDKKKWSEIETKE